MNKKAIEEILESEGLLERFMETLVDEINNDDEAYGKNTLQRILQKHQTYEAKTSTISGKTTTISGKMTTFSVRRGNNFSMGSKPGQGVSYTTVLHCYAVTLLH